MRDEELDQRIREVVRSTVASAPPAPPLDPGGAPAHRLPAVIAVVTTLVVVAVVVAGISVVRDGTNSRVETPAGTSRCREREVPAPLEGTPVPVLGSWETLPLGPVDGRTVAAAVWTGKEVIAWGSQSDASTDDERVSGAAYNPASNSWREIPDAPVAFRTDNAGGTTVATWTGREMLVWGKVLDQSGAGGGGGAAYDPRNDRWRRLPDAPLQGSDFSSLVAIWSGREMVISGGADGAGAAYNPCTDRWRSISPSPLGERWQTTAVWTGTEVLVSGGSGFMTPPMRDGAAYDPRTNTWRTIRGAPVRGYTAPSAVWSGHEMVVWGWSALDTDRAAGNEAIAYDPEDDAWRRLERAPLVSFPRDQQVEGTGGSVAVWAGDRVLAWSGTLDAAGPLVLEYRPGPDRWTRLASAPAGSQAYSPSAVWTGRALIVLGAGPEGQALALTTRV